MGLVWQSKKKTAQRNPQNPQVKRGKQRLSKLVSKEALNIVTKNPALLGALSRNCSEMESFPSAFNFAFHK